MVVSDVVGVVQDIVGVVAVVVILNIVIVAVVVVALDVVAKLIFLDILFVHFKNEFSNFASNVLRNYFLLIDFIFSPTFSILTKCKEFKTKSVFL